MIIKRKKKILDYMRANCDKIIKHELLNKDKLETLSITYEDIIFSNKFKTKCILMKDKYVDTIFTKLYSKKHPEINKILINCVRYRKC